MKYILKVIFELILIALVVSAIAWWLVTKVLPEFM